MTSTRFPDSYLDPDVAIYDPACVQLVSARVNFERTTSLKGKSLRELLDISYRKQCQLSRDRIFSILDLCDPPVTLAVDYDIPPLQLAENVIRATDEPFCLCFASLIARCLGLHHKSQDERAPDTPFRCIAHATMPVITSQSIPEDCGHVAVTGLDQDARDQDPAESQTRVWIPFNLISLCTSYPLGDKIALNITSSHTRSFDAEKDRFMLRFADGRAKVLRGCRVRIDDEYRSCTVDFSVEALLVLSMTESIAPNWQGSTCCLPLRPSLSRFEGQSDLRLCLDGCSCRRK